MAAKTLADIDVNGKTVLMRVDFNVPLKGERITDDRRIRAALPSVQNVLGRGGRLVLMSHLGRPDGAYDPSGTLAPCAARLGELLGRTVKLGPPDVIGAEAQAMAAGLEAGEVLLLENVRFHPGETLPDKAKKNPDKKLTPEQAALHQAFVRGLAALGDTYVNDAFGTCHRKHASMYGVAEAVRAKGGAVVAGFLVEREIRYLHEALAEPRRPFVAILGGAKVSDKIRLIGNLLGKVDQLLIGGAMAYTLLAAKGAQVAMSRVEADQLDEMKRICSGPGGDKIVLPCDHVATANFDFKALVGGAPVTVAGVDVPPGLMGMDIGPETRAAFARIVASAGTVVWNGPMGVFEASDYAAGTRAVAEALAKATAGGSVSIIGGGDSAAAVERFGLAEHMTHVSTGGGASLEYLEGRPMPPIDILDRA